VLLLTEALISLVNFTTFLPRKLVGAVLGGIDPMGDALDKAQGKVAGLRKSMGELMDSGWSWMKQGAGRFANTTDLADTLLGGGGGGRRPGAMPGSPAGVVVGEKGGTGTTKEVTDKVGEAFKKLSDAMRVAQGMSQLLGDQFDLNKAQASALEDALGTLLELGFSPLDPVMVGLRDRLAEVSTEAAKVSDEAQALADTDYQLTQAMMVADVQAGAFGSSFDKLGAQASALESAITSLATFGFDASNPIMAAYIKQLGLVYKAQGMAMEQSTQYGIAVSNLSSLIAGAIGGELKEVAKAKAKENLLLAAEQLAHGFVSLLSPFTAPKAGGHFAQAAEFGAIAAGWAALGASLGGGASSGSGAAASGAGGSSGPASQGAKPIDSEVHIYLTGPGFDAVNPVVQKVVWGAMEQARERVGSNARVNIIRRAS
jgi:hypothetical protein